MNDYIPLPNLFGESMWDEMESLFTSASKCFPASTSVPYDVTKYDDRTVLEIAVAGFKKDEIEVNVEKDHLIVSANTDSSKEKDEESIEGRILRKGISKRNFSYSFVVGDWADRENINAKIDNGILSVTVPNKKEADKKDEKISIPIL